MILALPRNLNTLQTIVHGPLPPLQLQPGIRPIGEEQRVPRVLLHGLCVEVLCGREVPVLECEVALLFESVGEVGHSKSRREKE